MRNPFWMACAFVFFLAGSARGSGPVDIMTLGEYDLVETDAGDAQVYSSGGTQSDNLVLFAYNDTAITVGSSGGTPELGVGATFSFFMTEMQNRTTLDIVAAAGADRGTVVMLGSIRCSEGVIVTVHPGVDSTETGKNRLIVELFEDRGSAPYSGTFVVNENSALEVRHSAFNSKTITFHLAGGELSFVDSATMNSASLLALSGDNLVVAPGGITLHRSTSAFLPDMPAVRVHGGASLTLLKDRDGTERGDLTIGTDGILDVRDGGVLNAGVVRFTRDCVLDQTQSGTVNADGLEFVSLEDAAGLDWRVRDAVAFSGTYTTKGSGNLYAGGMRVAAGGALAADAAADTRIFFGSAGSRGELRVEGGVIRAAGGNAFAIVNADVILAGSSAGATLDASAGGLDLSQSALIVDAPASAGVVAFDAAGGIVAGTYAQRSGVVEATGAAAGFVVLGEAVIGDGAAAATYRAVSDAGSFQGGLAIRENGVLEGTAGGGAIGLGGDLSLAGGTLDGTAGLLTLTGTSGLESVRVVGGDSVVRGFVSTALGVVVDADAASLRLENAVLEAGSFLLKRGAAYAAAAPATIRSAGSGGGVFRVGAGGTLEARTADLNILGYDAVAIDGTYVAGWDGSDIAALRADSDIVFGATAGIGFTSELLANLRPGADAVIMEVSGSGNEIRTSGPLDAMSIFGVVGMDVVDGKLAVTSMDSWILGDYSAADIALAVSNLRRVWGGEQISPALGELAYGAATSPYPVSAAPGDGGAGEKNVALLRALANPAGQSISRNTVEYMNGAHLSGVNEVAVRTAAAVSGRIAERIRGLHGEFNAAREAARGAAGSEAALPSLAMNAAEANRFWFSAMRMWEEVEDGGGFSGYEYDSHGFVMGYDRALSGNIALGAAVSFNRGDYGDGGALAHASDIGTYGVSVYGVYSHDGGFYVGGTAGYGYSDNDIRELRHDPSVAVGHSWAEAGYYTGTWVLGVDAGFEFGPWEYLTLTPSFGLTYVRAGGGDHDAYLGGVATQRERDIVGEAFLLPLRLSGRYELPMGDGGRLRLTASIGYMFNFLRGGVGGRIDYYGLSRPAGLGAAGRAMSRHMATVGLGMRFVYRRFDFGVDYDYVSGSGYSSHRLAGSMGASF